MTNPLRIELMCVIRFNLCNKIKYPTDATLSTSGTIHVSSLGVTPMLRQSDDMNILKSIEAPCLSAPTGLRGTVHSPLKSSSTPIFDNYTATGGWTSQLRIIVTFWRTGRFILLSSCGAVKLGAPFARRGPGCAAAHYRKSEVTLLQARFPNSVIYATINHGIPKHWRITA